MSTAAIADVRPGTVKMKLEVVAIPVADVDRAKEFYGRLGWRLDADFAAGGGRTIQFTPPGSECSVHFGKNITTAPVGTAQGLFLIVSDTVFGRELEPSVAQAGEQEPVAAATDFPSVVFVGAPPATHALRTSE